MSIELGRREFVSAIAALAACSPNEGRRDAGGSTAPEQSASAGAQSAVALSARAPEPSASARPDRPLARRSGVELLEGRYPGFASIASVSLGDLPTPVVQAPELGKAIGVGELWIKRDDRSSTTFGGGKLRKLQRFFADARKRGYRDLVTFGGVGSNHAVATAAFGGPLGFGVTVRLAPQPASDLVARHLAACVHFGARIESIDGVDDAFHRAVRDARGAEPAASMYVIPPGGTSNLGDLGFVDAAFELADQIARKEMPSPDVIVAAMGTMGSVAGLAFGLPAAGLPSSILAVRCSSSATSGPGLFERMCRELHPYLGSIDRGMKELAASPVTIEASALGPGYGRSTPDAERAISLARDLAGLELEATYTGKALAGLKSRASSLSKQCVLFWASQPAPIAFDPHAIDPAAIPRELRKFLDAPREPRTIAK